MKSIKTILSEQLQYAYLIRRLSMYELKKTYIANMLGIVWVFLNPIIQIGVYWIIFGLGIRGGAPVNGVPYFVWMISGLVPWFYISSAIIQGSNSIYARLSGVSKMNFPLSIIPSYVILSRLYTHLILTILLTVIVIVNQGISSVHFLVLIYGMLSLTIFLIALSFITSTLSTIVRDVHLLIQSVTRMLFFITPILWEPKENMPQLFLSLMKLNPFYYVIELYREALVYDSTSILFSAYTLYFWGIIIFMFTVGSMLHVRFRRQFIDYL
ncbi:ABC transporter permease [Bacillus anthracis]|uniref:ABC transporter permease n=1 Tax=Bacillus anthracis TaxID=1392 RepID=UPI002540F561|nr:ABC transporter permease [Bacillus anthracis]WIG21841.1 ABC transporter permease [Bacillus anthracis]